MRRSLLRTSRLSLFCLVGLQVSACSRMDPRLPHQLPPPAVPNAPLVSAPGLAANALVAPPAAAEPDTAERMLSAPTWANAQRLDAFAGASLERAKAALTKVQSGNPEAGALLADFDTVFREVDTASGLLGLLVEVSPDPLVRETAAKRDEAIARFRAEVWLDRKVYDQLSKLDPAAVEAAGPLMTRFLERSLQDFRLAGVDQDEPTRARLAAIQGDIKKLSQDYSERLNQDTRTVEVDPAKLADMPKDWLASHAPNAAGKIAVTTDYPDFYPVLEYAADDATRRALWDTSAARGMPENATTLKQILTLRKEAATLLGKANWAAFSVQDGMAKTPETVAAFIEEIATAARPRSDKDIARALAAKQDNDPNATAIEVWDRFYFAGLVKKQDASFDSELVRPYFPYTAVKDGIFALYGELFGVTFKRLEGVDAWSSKVESWAMLRGEEELGRFWLDMHPRADKFKHAAMFPIQAGLDGARKQMPWGALVCNFPEPGAGGPGDKALMTHDDVVTFFHEFGHLVHHLSARGPTLKLAGDNEGDFIEAPSQLLEEWAWRPEILQRFAKHVDTGEVIPTELVAKMKKADSFGRGMDLMRQIFLSAFSWFSHVEDPAALDFDAFTTAMYKRYSPYPRPEVDQLYANFGHLTDYSSNYYTYQWSLAIAKDLYTRFAANPMDPAVAADYRTRVLAAGATKDAADLVADFLGRPQNLDAYRAWISSE